MRKVISVLIIASIFLVNGVQVRIAFAEPTTILIPSNFTFNTNMSLGTTRAPDISYLKRFLNYDARTRLAETDPCIATPFSNYFDMRTRDAVIKFQNIYRSETLTPAGLTSGSGFVGIYTRSKINKLLRTAEYAQIIGPAITTTITSATTSTGARPVISSVTPQQLSNCQQTITIIGQNFHPINNYLVGTIGHLLASSTPFTGMFIDQNGQQISTLATSTPYQAITFTIRQFSDYNAIQNLYAGTTQTIVIRIQNATLGLTSEQSAIVQYTFPGTQNTVGLPKLQGDQPRLESLSGKTGSNSGSGSSGNNSGNSGASGAGVAAGTAVLGGLLGASSGGSGGGTQTSVSTGMSLNFGGKLVNNTTCTCSSNSLLIIQDVRGMSKQLIFSPGVSRLYQYYNLSAGVNTLGTYVGGGSCVMYAITGCYTYGAPIGTITQIGTSKGTSGI